MGKGCLQNYTGTLVWLKKNTVSLKAKLGLPEGFPAFPQTLKPSNFGVRITERLLSCTCMFVSVCVSAKWLLVMSFGCQQLKLPSPPGIFSL